MKKRIKIIFIVLSLLFCFSFNYTHVNADIYKDKDYIFTSDGEDNNSSEVINNNNNQNNTQNENKNNSNIVNTNNIDVTTTIIIVVLCIIGLQILFFIIYFLCIKFGLISSDKDKKNERIKNQIIDTQNKILNELPNFDFERFYDEVFNIFNDIAIARSGYGYDELRRLLAPDLYNQYYSELSSFEKDKKKYYLLDCLLDDIYLTDFSKGDSDYSITVVMRTNQYEYIINSKENVISGSKDKKVEKKYILTFVKSINENSLICPKCGSPILDGVSSICPFCNSVIINKKYEWLLSSIKEK